MDHVWSGGFEFIKACTLPSMISLVLIQLSTPYGGWINNASDILSNSPLTPDTVTGIRFFSNQDFSSVLRLIKSSDEYSACRFVAVNNVSIHDVWSSVSCPSTSLSMVIVLIAWPITTLTGVFTLFRSQTNTTLQCTRDKKCHNDSLI